jgi:TorA maturation chaperone TorD/uncharacterized membrane protein
MLFGRRIKFGRRVKMGRFDERGMPRIVAIFDRPIHPMLLVFPIGFVGAFATDLALSGAGYPSQVRTSEWLLRAGVVASTLGAMAGLIGFVILSRVRSLTAGWADFLGNATAVSLAELARGIGAYRPSLSNCSQVPAGHVLSMEAMTGGARTILRPDSGRGQLGEPDDVDAARAQEYALLAVLLARAPDAALLARIAKLRGDATTLGVAHAALAQAADTVSVEKIAREFFDLFTGVGRGELLPYGSYYLTGFLNERPLARLREDLRALGIERVERQGEPEDHAAILCEIMAGLADGRFSVPVEAQQKIFEKHLAPWIAHFFADMERADAADFYRHVGAVGRLFIEIETKAFSLPD